MKDIHVDFLFKRPQLALAFCDALAGKGITNARSGLFLAGPRRVGKTTFLKDELMPEAKSRKWFTLYVDLWENRQADPGALIFAAIHEAISSFDSKVKRIAKKARIERVGMGKLSVDLSSKNQNDNLTIAHALKKLHSLAKKPTVFIIDEAQHALTTETGLNALYGLKSARDQLNSQGSQPVLKLVFTGSNRDKLGHLLLRKDQPFFGAEITPFPLLDKDFTDAFTNWVNKNLAATNQFDEESVWQAFKWVGHRPEILRQLAGRLALGGAAGHFTQRLKQDAQLWHDRIWEEFENQFNTLSPLQQTVLHMFIRYGVNFSPFSESAMREYQNIFGDKNEKNEISTASIQTAIQSLREKGFIWQSGRGSYALEDDSLAEWYKM